MSYAAAKGRAAKVAQPVFTDTEPEELTPQQESVIAQRKEMVCEYMPEMVSIVRKLHAEGLIDGWRNVTRCTLLDGGHD